MKALESDIATIILLLICLAIAGFAWLFISSYYEIYTSKTITIIPGSEICTGSNTAAMTIRNLGTASIGTADPPPAQTVGNMVPNAGFERDMDNNNKPDSWGKDEKLETIDVVLITDLSNSMADCMDSRQTMPDKGTILLNHFDDGTANDESRWRNNGVISGATYLENGGVSGGAFSFDGIDDYIEYASSPSFDFLGESTVSLWVKTTGASTAFIGKNDYAGTTMYGRSGQWLIMIDNAGKLKYHSWMDSGCFDLAGSKVINDGKWHHVAAVISVPGKTIKFYVDGSLDTSGVTWSITNSAGKLFLGSCGRVAGAGWCSYSCPSNYFNGILDEVAIYNRALSENEIKEQAMALPCGDDGRTDKPAWCAYETDCPAGCLVPEEGYCKPISEAVYYKAPYQKSYTYVYGGCASDPAYDKNCAADAGCDRDCGTGRAFNSYILKTNPTGEDDTDCKKVIEGQYSGCSAYPRSSSSICGIGDTQYRFDCLSLGKKLDSTRTYYPTTYRPADSNNPNPCLSAEYAGRYVYEECSDFGRDSSTSGCPAAGQECGRRGEFAYNEGTKPVEGWQDACLPNEYPSGETRGKPECMESCISDWEPGTGCDPSCSGLKPQCCVSKTQIQQRCIKCVDTCCKVRKRACKQCYDYCCDHDFTCVTGRYCCNNISVCQPSAALLPSGRCEPGLQGGMPLVADECATGGAWQCKAEGGCHYCSSVAIRLAKKLDTDFVNTLFSHAPTAQVGLVSYGTQAVSSVGLTGEGAKDAALLSGAGGINNYHADNGDTCISCAIKKAIGLFSGSMANKRYAVLMSDGDANRCAGSGDGSASDKCGETDSAKINQKASAEAIRLACDYNTANADKQIIFYTVGFGKEAGRATLQAIADCSPKNDDGSSKGRYFQGNDPEELAQIYSTISQQIGNAGIDRESKVYGSQSMLLAVTSDPSKPPIATSDKFTVHYSGTQKYIFSFYRKLDITAGKLMAAIRFYDSSGSELTPGFAQEYTPDMYGTSSVGDPAFVKEEFTINQLPEGASEASIVFNFEGSPEGNSVNIDDVYFGPEIKCQKEAGGGYVCGDIVVEKTSADGDIYPYFKMNPLKPGTSVTIEDANCRGNCRYKISTISSVADASVVCNG